MASVATLAMSRDGDRHIHPFFARGGGKENNAAEETGELEKPETNTENDPAPQLESTAENTIETIIHKKSTIPSGLSEKKPQKQQTIQDILNPKPAAPAEIPQNEVHDKKINNEHDNAMEYAEESERRKRRRTGEFISAFVGESNPTPAPADVPRRPSSPRVIIPAAPVNLESIPEDHLTPMELDEPAPTQKTPPKKLLRLNASGRFSSPVSNIKRQDNEKPAEGTKRQRTLRERKEKIEPKKSLPMVLPYGRDPTKRGELGTRINRILAGEESLPKPPPKKTKAKRAPKNAHPFFGGKSKNEPAPVKRDSPRKASAVGPGKLRMQTQAAHSTFPESREAPYAVESALLKDRMIVKHPGAADPLWPSRDQSHVRGLEPSDVVSQIHEVPNLRTRKMKGARRPFPEQESILHSVDIADAGDEDSRLRPDGFHDPHPQLRLPGKHLLAGAEILQRESGSISVPLDLPEDELAAPSQSPIHPALRRLQHIIPTSLTAWDEGQGEAVAWPQKYAPTAVADVLQPGRETIVLKEWLISLKVNSVEGSKDPDRKTARKPEPKPKKKRKKKNDELDDFLVESDEELHDMDEISEPEDLTPSQRSLPRSVVHSINEGSKVSNAVLLSGPHGCGKTASAYAVAKELGFKVFEISSSERRSGKDVLERIGDMTENHLVKHHGSEAGEVSSSEEPSANEEAFMRDLASGRQGTMGSFFKPKTAVAKPKPVELKKKVAQSKIMEAVQSAIRKPPKDQQQSLILLEEVDIIFKDDKEFWTTVLKLITTSKRPFILTCNDEDLVPIQAIKLHAILRMTPPPVDLATDYMLLMAAAEGHLLKRDAVVSLYGSKRHDLRASISTLDLWCQMGVGDPRGGLAWIYQRWPRGSDIDQHGRKLRVVSEETYQDGMGIQPELGLDEDTSTLWKWQEFDIAPTELFKWNDMDGDEWLDESIGKATDQKRLSALKSFSRFAEHMSCMDEFTNIGLSGALIDTTQPDLTDKARKHYIEGMRVLQTDELADHSQMSKKLAVASTSLSYRAFGIEQPTAGNRKNARKDVSDSALNRRDFACFDAISAPEETALSMSQGLTQSVFDGPFDTVTTELAPYVRSIVQFYAALDEQRDRLNGIMTEGDSSQRGKRARNTRAARSAMDGVQRATARKDRWFTKQLDYQGVLATGGSEWPKTVIMEESETPSVAAEEDNTIPSTAESL